jgi:phosphoribosylformimino-5-aminoimidazole carboxamide ribotide isomerase
VDLLPAIDIRAGRVVRLRQGAPGQETVYGGDPAAQAEEFVAAGASWIHVVDLDRAFGEGENLEAIARVVKQVGGRVRLQVSGGLRNPDLVRAVFARGATRVVVGTAAVTDAPMIGELITEMGPEAIGVALDSRDGFAAIRGWIGTSNDRVEDVCRRVLSAGVRTVIYTDIARDGMLSGPDIAGGAALQRLGASVIASGGVSTLDDLRAVKRAGLAGAIVGRAIYEGRFTVEAALACC